MKYLGFAATCALAFAALVLTACNKQKEQPKKPHDTILHLPYSDPRAWAPYPVLVLISEKHGVSVSVLAKLVKDYDEYFGGLGMIESAPQAPARYEAYQGDTPTVAADVAFFRQEAAKLGLSPAEAASMLVEFYGIAPNYRVGN